MKRTIAAIAGLIAAAAISTQAYAVTGWIDPGIKTDPAPRPTEVVAPAPVTQTSSPSTTSGVESNSNSHGGSASVGAVTGGHVGNISTGGATASLTSGSNTANGGLGGAGGSGGAANSTNAITGGSNTAAGGNASATGGVAGDSSASSTSGPSTSYSAAGARTGSITDASSSSSSSKYLSLSLPQPVWTSVPTAFGCLVSKSKAWAIGMNFVSASGTEQVSDAVCTTIRMAEAATLHCHFASAAHLNKRAFEQMYPGTSGDFFLADDPKNLGPVACDELKRPKLRMESAIAPAPQITVSPVINNHQPEKAQASCTQKTIRKASVAPRKKDVPAPGHNTCQRT